MRIPKEWHPLYFFGGWAEFWRPLLFIALPIMLQNLVSSSMYVVNNMMVGALGDAPLAGVSQANQLQFILRLTMFGVASGASILIAQQWGNRDVPALRRTSGIMLAGTVTVGLVGFIAATLFPQAILSLFVHDDETMAFAMSYLPRVAPSYLFASVTAALGNANKATEKALLPMTASIIAIVLNTFLCWCMIYGNLGFPELGVAGAATATVIATCLEMMLLAFFTWACRYPIAGKPREMIVRSRAELRTFFRVATPVVLNEGLWGLGVTVYAMVYGIMGTTTVAAMAVFGVIDQMVWAAGWGLMTGSAVLVGKRIGAGDFSGARTMARRLLTLTVIVGLVLGVGLLLPFGRSITGLFSASAEARSMAGGVLGVFGCLLFIKLLNAVNVVGVLRSGGDSVFTMTLDIVGVWCVGIPMAFLGGVVLRLPLHWVYLMLQSEEVLKSFVGIRRYLSGKWVKRLVEDEAKGSETIGDPDTMEGIA